MFFSFGPQPKAGDDNDDDDDYYNNKNNGAESERVARAQETVNPEEITRRSPRAPEESSSEHEAPSSIRTVTYDDIPPEARELLERYSGVSREDVPRHVAEIRSRILQVTSTTSNPARTIPMTGPTLAPLHLLRNPLTHAPYTPMLLQRLRNGAPLLSVNTALGALLRYLVHTEHIPWHQLSACDPELSLLELGYELFRDREALGSAFFPANLDAEPDGGPESAGGLWKGLQGKFGIVHAGRGVFEGARWEVQRRAARRLVELCKKEGEVLVAGVVLGAEVAGVDGKGGWRHDVDSLRGLWEAVIEEAGGTWRAEVRWIDEEDEGVRAAGGEKMLWFCLARG